MIFLVVMDRCLSKVGSNENLVAIGKRVKLRDCIKTRHKQYPLEGRAISDTVEAILGAVYLDTEPRNRMKIVNKVMRTLGLL